MKAILDDSENKILSDIPQNRSEAKKLAPVRDIAGRKSRQEEKVKKDAIANLAAGIAHQFNNALVGIAGNMELLKMDLPEDENIDKYIEPMEACVRRMVHLTNQLLAYARGGKYQPKPLSLTHFLEESLPLIQHTMDPAIRLETDLSSDMSTVEADPTQMQMVLSAVLANASEAIEGPGRIRITSRNEWIDEAFGGHHPSLEPGAYVCLMIEDDGKGMDEKTRGKVFEPFFTTKFQGRGLGMAAVYGIVTSHEGGISIDSQLGRGTVIRIYLPASQVEVEEAEEREMQEVKSPGKMLVREDEEAAIGG